MLETPTLTPSEALAFDLLSCPVLVFAADTLRFLASNKAAQDWVGYDPRTLHSLSVADVQPGAERPRIDDTVNWTVVSSSGDHYAATFHCRKILFDGLEAIVASVTKMRQIAAPGTDAGPPASVEKSADHHALPAGEHLACIFDTLPGKMLVLTPDDFVIVAATDEYAQTVAIERGSLVGRRLFEVFPSDPTEPDAEGVSRLLASLRRAATLRVADVMNVLRYPVRGEDGAFHERFWLPHNKPVFDRSGRLIYIIHRTEDVTELLGCPQTETTGPTDLQRVELDTSLPVMEARTALLALQEREARLRAAENLLEIGAWEYDLDRRKLNWSDRVFDMYGVPNDQGAPNFDEYVAIVHPDDRPQMLSVYADFTAIGAAQFEFQHRAVRPDGSVATIRGVGARHRSDGREIILGYAQDVTRYVEAEQRLRSAARLQKVAGYMARLGSWRLDLDPLALSWSAETADIHGEPEGTTPGVAEAMSYYIPEHRDRIRGRIEACISAGVPFDEVLQIVTAKGKRAWVRAIGEAARNETGQIVALEGAFQDISDLVAARDGSETLARRLRQTLEHISDAFFLLDDDWCFSFLNSQAEALLQRRREDLLGKSLWQEFPEALGRSFQTEYQRAVAESRSVRFHEFYPGLEAWFEVDAYPTPEGLAVYFRDVTQQRVRDEQLRLLESAVSRQTDILVITEVDPIDAPGGPKIVYVNDAFEKRTGYARHEVLGKTPRILQGPNTQRSELDRIRRALESWHPVRAELINYTRSGEEFWLELDIVPLANDTGQFTHWVAIERDVTERRRAEDALRLSEERFRLISKATGNAIWEWDVVSKRQWWSDGLIENFGHHPGSEGSPPTIWRTNIHPEDRPGAEAALARLFSGQADTLHERYRFRRSDGKWARVEDRAFVIRDSEGGVQRILGSMTDISERLMLEEQFFQSQKLEAVGQLTGGVAHDFNNLLTVIIGSTEFLQDELPPGSPLRRHADMTARAAERAAELTSRLLAFSRKQALQPRVIDMNRLILGMEEMLRRTLGEALTIRIVPADDLWLTEVDPGQLDSALLNLAINSRDAMSNGGSLTVETANVWLDSSFTESDIDLIDGDYVAVSVTDTGHGIPPDQIERVFEPFFTTKDVSKGTGLGLSMVYGFVMQSGGLIRVSSEVGEGTNVSLYFPRVHSAEKGEVEKGKSQFSGGSETILVVEDHPLLLQQVSAQLAGLGYSVRTATSGEEAMEIIRARSEIDLLFTDLVLPGGQNGREIAEQARAIRPGLKILFTSGYLDDAILHDGRVDPDVALLSKPYRREALAEKVREVLDSD